MTDEMKKPTMFTIKKTASWGSGLECEYATSEEAQAALDKMHENAVTETKKWEELMAEHPQPWDSKTQTDAFIKGYYSGKSPLDAFEENGWHIVEIPATCHVYRLNTLPKESPELVKEIEAKIALFKECDLSWTCHGHTRAEWQTEAAALQLKAIHPEWKVTSHGDTVYVSA